jgi:hypothetical protein
LPFIVAVAGPAGSATLTAVKAAGTVMFAEPSCCWLVRLVSVTEKVD